MKKKYLFIATLALVLGVGVSGCYVERGYDRPYYHRYDRDRHHRDYDRRDHGYHDYDHRGGGHDDH
ncbi:MAG: hypothetical protein ACRDE8_04605 [Ginsengibacter sp.]